MAGCLLLLPLAGGCSDFRVPPLHGDARPTARVVVDLPPDQRAAAELALREASGGTNDGLGGLAVEPVYVDDTLDGEPSPGAAARRLEDLLRDSSVVAMVGPLNAQVARREIPVASQAGLAIVSPDLADSCLTQDHDWCTRGEPASLYPKGSLNGSRGWQSFWRVGAVDTAAGAAAADYATTTLGLGTALAIDDGTAYGGAVAGAFATRFTTDGGAVASRAHADPARPPSRAALLQDVAAKHVDVVYLGGRSASLAAAIAADLQGATARLFVGDALVGAGAAALGPAGDGVYGVSLSPDPARTDADLARTLAARLPGGRVSGGAVNAYLATRVVLAAIARATDAIAGQATSVPVRGVVTGQLALKTSYFVSDSYGVISFNPAGDDNDQVVSFWQVKGGGWSLQEQGSFQG